MADTRLAMQKQMLVSHTKLLEKFMREGQQEKVAEWQAKVDNLRTQIEQSEGGMPTASSQPSSQPLQQYQPSFNQPIQQQQVSHVQVATAPQYPAAQQQQQSYAAPKTEGVSVKRANEMLSDSNMTLTMQLASRDTEIEEKTLQIENIQKQTNDCKETIQSIQNTSAERISQLEKDLICARADVEQERTKLQNEINDILSSHKTEIEEQKRIKTLDTNVISENIKEKDDEIQKLIQHLAALKSEDESACLAAFVNKTLDAIKLTSQAAKEKGTKSDLVVESKSNLGFSNFTVRSVVDGDGSFTIQQIK